MGGGGGHFGGRELVEAGRSIERLREHSRGGVNFLLLLLVPR